MTGRFRFGKISTGMRVIARIEQSATPSTMTTTLIGLLSAARSSHIARDLPEPCRVRPAGRDQDRLGRRKQKPNSARRRAAQERRQFPLARAGFARRRRLQGLPALLGNASVPGLRLCARLAILPEYSRRLGERLRGTPVPSAIAPSDPAGLDRSERLRHVHWPIQLPF